MTYLSHISSISFYTLPYTVSMMSVLHCIFAVLTMDGMQKLWNILFVCMKANTSIGIFTYNGECISSKYRKLRIPDQKCETGNHLKAETEHCEIINNLFYTTFFRQDVLWCGDVRPGLRPSVRLRPGLRPPVFQFYPTCFEILSWNFVYDFVLLYYRSSSGVVILRQLLKELCPFWNLECWKYAAFHTFLLHALTYWAEILHMTLFYCTTD